MDVCEAHGKWPGKFTYAHPVIDYSAASSKDKVFWLGVKSYCFISRPLLSVSQANVEQRHKEVGVWGRGKKYGSQKAYCSGVSKNLLWLPADLALVGYWR